MATGAGAIVGVQGCWLAGYGFGASIPWYGRVWILLSHLVPGFSVGATAGLTCWWKRGPVLGLPAAIPSSFGAVALGLRWTPYGVAALAEGVAAGLLIAFVADALHPQARTQRYTARHAESEECVSYATYRRLAEEKACLERTELLELELQDIDEQANRICQAAGSDRRGG